MNNMHQNILETIGNTPIVKLNHNTTHVESEIYVKLEYFNPGGSVKDRVGYYILQEAKRRGELKEGATIIEGTSGNTGVGLALYSAIHGHKCIFVIPDKQSMEKIQNLRAMGAKVIICPTNVEPDDPRSYYSVSRRLGQTIPNAYFVNQYHNLLNQETHYKTTGPEIYNQTNGQFDIFMAGVGTGGTISGIGRYLKEKNPNIKIVGVDIEGSILAHYHKTKEITTAHPYVLEGIGEDIIPSNINFETIDDFVTVQDKESFLMTRKLLVQEGIYAGGSSGAAVMGAIHYAKKLTKPQKILVLLPDSGNRYTSKIYSDKWMRENGYYESEFQLSIQDVLRKVQDQNPKKSFHLYKLSSNAIVKDAVQMMKQHQLSQLPVLDNNQIIGVVSEKDLLHKIIEGLVSLDDNILVAVSNNFKTFEMKEKLSNVAGDLLQNTHIFITQNGELTNILTPIDILNSFSTHERR